jgi:hypothetical protein
VILKIKKKRREQTIAALKVKVWKVFSIYIRTREKTFQDTVSCFTCDRVDHWKTFDAGHYIPKSTGGAALYFHEKNVHPQCTGCNRFRHGNLTQYALRLQNRYGNKILTELDTLRGQPWSRKELERLLVYYTAKVKQIQ